MFCCTLCDNYSMFACSSNCTVYIVRKQKKIGKLQVLSIAVKRGKILMLFLYELRLSYIVIYMFLVNMFYLDLSV